VPIIPKSIAFLGLSFEYDQFSSHGIALFDTKLLKMPISLFEMPLDFIQEFYKNITNINECKIIFLGDGEVGKTSLIERIVKHDEYIPDRPPTDGILIKKHKRNILGKDVTLRIWDFGGQEVMHTMHKCFLTSRTVYVIVLDARENQFFNRTATHWLKTVEAFAPDCPAILVINKIDHSEDAAVNEADLKKLYPNLQLPVVRTSAKKNIGIEDLKTCIDKAVEKGEMFTSIFNSKWFPIKEALEAMSSPYIKQEDYVEICKRANETNVDIQSWLLRWFKDLGISYYYEGQDIGYAAQNITVLNPNWITGGIYRLITKTEKNNAFIEHSTVKKVIEKAHPNDITKYTYKGEEIDFVLDVMAQFEISLKCGDVVFVPLKLNKTTPDAAKGFVDEEQSLHLSWEAEYMPYNAIHRLMIKMFDDLDKDCVWLNGAGFISRDGKRRVLMRMDLEEKKIHAFVGSTEQDGEKEYLSHIRDKLNDILKQLNLKFDEYIHYRIDGKSGKIKYSVVLDQYHDGANRIYLEETKQYADPRVLLRLIHTDDEIENDRMGGATVNVYKDSNVVYGRDGNVNVNTGKQRGVSTFQETHTTNYVNWVDNLPSEATSAQMDEFLKAIEAFLNSKEYGKMTLDEAKQLESALEEYKNPIQDKKKRWGTVRDFFMKAGKEMPGLVSKFSKFVQDNPAIFTWLKSLIGQ